MKPFGSVNIAQGCTPSGGESGKWNVWMAKASSIKKPRTKGGVAYIMNVTPVNQ